MLLDTSKDRATEIMDLTPATEARFADKYGRLKARMAKLQKLEEKMKEKASKYGKSEFEGKLFKICVDMRTSSRFDATAFKEFDPETHAKFMKSSTSIYVTVKNIK